MTQGEFPQQDSFPRGPQGPTQPEFTPPPIPAPAMTAETDSVPDAGERELEVVDSVRTTRTHAGEAISDSRNWPGYVLLVLGLASLGFGIVAAGDGFGGWSAVLFPAAAVFFIGGLVSVLLVRKRVKNAEGLDLMDAVGH